MADKLGCSYPLFFGADVVQEPYRTLSGPVPDPFCNRSENVPGPFWTRSRAVRTLRAVPERFLYSSRTVLNSIERKRTDPAYMISPKRGLKSNSTSLCSTGKAPHRPLWQGCWGGLWETHLPRFSSPHDALPEQLPLRTARFSGVFPKTSQRPPEVIPKAPMRVPSKVCAPT